VASRLGKIQAGGALQGQGSAAPVTSIELAELRDAIHAARKMAIVYLDERGHRTARTIRPIAMAYYVDVTMIAA
jgi:predicted DNA-binding transcriptional regulator YafY